MAETVLSEFPFVKTLPKREKGKLAKLWQHLEDLAAIEQRKGKLIQVSFAADLMSVHRSRVHQLIDAGKLEKVDVNGHPFVTVQSVAEYCETERKAGRPAKVTVPRGLGIFKTAVRMAREKCEYLDAEK